LDVRLLVDEEDRVWFAVIGNKVDLVNTSFEFDFPAEDGFTVVFETSVSAEGGAPPWVETAPLGSVVEISGVAPAVSGLVQSQSDAQHLYMAAYMLLGLDTEKREYFERRQREADEAVGVSLSSWAYRNIAQVSGTQRFAGRLGASALHDHYRCGARLGGLGGACPGLLRDGE
jgi:hypothetical protein